MNTFRLLLVLCLLYGIGIIWQSITAAPGFHLSQSQDPSPTPQKFDTVIPLKSVFAYPRGHITSITKQQLTQISSDEGRVIFDWYKQQFAKQAISLQNYSQVNHHDIKIYTMNGVKNNLSISLSIRKDELDSATIIEISEKSQK